MVSPRLAKWGKRFAYSAAGLGAGFATFDYATDRSGTRSLRTLAAFAKIAYWYKYTTPETPEELSRLHSHVAHIILDTCLKNEGLYIKFGQFMNSMSHVLPKEYTETLRVLLDQAPPVAIDDIRRTIREDTGKEIDEVFVRFDDKAVASASIAQVHQAWLPPPADSSSTEPVKVAVKVRKPHISTQAKWDLYTYSTIMKLLKVLFDLPTDWSRETVCDGLQREMDFRLEADNAKRFGDSFADNERVYIPHVFDAYTTKRLLVLEWIEGTKLIEVEAVRAKFDPKKILITLFDAVGDMVFKTGFVHCDPHAANVLVRPMPSSQESYGAANNHKQLHSRAGKRKADNYQVVLIDFGLVMPERVRFRLQYALLFVSLFTHDMDSLRRVVKDWGIDDPEMFASMQAQKPFEAIAAGQYGEVTREEVLELQRKAHARAKEMLGDIRRIPKELILVGRSLDILRGINRLYGSPVNRMNMFVQSAVECLGPLHNYDAVEQYLNRMQRVMKDSGVPAEVRHDSFQQYGSVFDPSAEAIRAAQETANAQMAAEDGAGFHLRGASLDGARGWLSDLYRSVTLNALLTFFSVMHFCTYTYNSFITAMLPDAVRKRLYIENLEDRIAHRMGIDDEAAEAQLAAAAG